MSQMVRKQIYIQKRQETMLKRLAKARRVSEAALIREAIDQTLSGATSRPFYADPEAWEKALALMRSLHARGPIPGRPRMWKREDAYEERLSRHGRNSG